MNDNNLFPFPVKWAGSLVPFMNVGGLIESHSSERAYEDSTS